MDWVDEIVEAFEALGGKAYYSELYEYIENTTTRYLTEEYQGTVRYTVQRHSSDSTTFDGTTPDLFQRIGRGYWGLRNWETQQTSDTQPEESLSGTINNSLDWREAVLEALHRFSDRHTTKIISRQDLIDEELDQIVKDAESKGVTPGQTLSRVLQELRDEEALYFLGEGRYLLSDNVIDVENEDLPEDAIDFAIKKRQLRIEIVETDDKEALTRRRKGQTRVRELTLENYGAICALCDVSDERLLVASHISRWSDDPEGRGNLSNVICLCRFHDALFEQGYLSISDDYIVLKKNDSGSQIIDGLLNTAEKLRLPIDNAPTPEFLKKHRERTGFES